MDPERSAASLGEHLEVASGLGRLHDAECVILPRDWEISGIVTRNLQENARFRSTLVGLARGMQEPRAEADAGRYFGRIADRLSDARHRRLVLGRHLDVGQQRHVITRAGPDEVSLQIILE